MLCFIEQSREYLLGKLRSGKQTAALIAQIKRYLPDCVNQVFIRADAEFQIWHSIQVDAIPSSRFKNNYAYFQIVMLAYNIWRYLKMIAELGAKTKPPAEKSEQRHGFSGIETNTVRIARLRLLMIAAKVVTDSNQDKIRYSAQDSRTPALMSFLKYLDLKRSQPRPWAGNVLQAAIG